MAGAPQFNDGIEQKIRNMILEILSRLPTTELLKQYVANLLKLAMYLLEVENEENAVVCGDMVDFTLRSLNIYI